MTRLEAAEKMDDADQERLSPSLVLTACISVLAGGFHFGYQMSIINPMADVVQAFITDAVKSQHSVELSPATLSWIWAAVAGLLFIGATIGALACPRLIRVVGSRRSVMYAAFVLCMSTPLTGFSHTLHSAELFIASRLVSGIGVGLGITANSVFLTEISPNKYRGHINSFAGFSCNIGFILASALGMPSVFGSETLWPVSFYIEAAPALIALVSSLLVFHDSPVFLMQRGDSRRCRLSLSFYSRGVDVDVELQQLKAQLLQRKHSNDRCDGEEAMHLWRHRVTRRALLLSVVLNVAVAFSGIAAMSFFGTFLLQSMGFSEASASLANCLSSFSGTAGAVCAMWTVDRIGRRLLIVGSLLALAAINTAMMMLVATFNATQEIRIGYAFLLLFIAFLFVFSAGISPTALFIGAELAPPAARAQVQALSVTAQYICCFLSPLLYYPLRAAAGSLSFLVFIIPLTASAVFFSRELPETCGKNSREIATELANGSGGGGERRTEVI